MTSDTMDQNKGAQKKRGTLPSKKAIRRSGKGSRAYKNAFLRGPLSKAKESFVEHQSGLVAQLVSTWPDEQVEEMMSGKVDVVAATSERQAPQSPPADSRPVLKTLKEALRLRNQRALDEIIEHLSEYELLEAVSSTSDFTALARSVASASGAAAAAEKDPLAGAMARSIRHREKIMDRAGEPMAAGQVALLLGIRRQAVDKRRERGRVLAVRQGSAWVYPSIQFQDGDVPPRLADVLNAHKDDDAWHVLDVLVAPDEAWGGRSLMGLLMDRDDEAIDRYIAQTKGDGFI